MSDPIAVDLGWRLLTDDDREREYSPSSCVGGDLTPFLTEYAQASERARRWCDDAGRPVQTVAYGPRESQTLDLAVPAVGTASPVLVFIHGGYWQELSKLDSFFPAPDFVTRGVAYAAVDYTLAPAATLDEIVAECRAALAILGDRAASLGIDPGRIVVAGSSAGAHLAAIVNLAPSAIPASGLVLLSGIFELEPLIGTSINDALHLDRDTARRNSPARLDIAHPPPAIVAVGENETEQFKRQSGLFARHLEASGSDVLELEAAGRNHFDIVLDLGRIESPLGRAVHRLLESTGNDHAER